jgi:hypothetical protein
LLWSTVSGPRVENVSAGAPTITLRATNGAMHTTMPTTSVGTQANHLRRGSSDSSSTAGPSTISSRPVGRNRKLAASSAPVQSPRPHPGRSRNSSSNHTLISVSDEFKDDRNSSVSITIEGANSAARPAANKPARSSRSWVPMRNTRYTDNVLSNTWSTSSITLLPVNQ